MKTTQLKCPSCGSTDLEKLKWNEYRCTHCKSTLRLDSEQRRLELTGWACPECGLENPIGQRFCSQCGTKLGKICPRCRALNYLDVRYCGSCGFAFRLQRAYSQLETRLRLLRQELAELQARQVERPITTPRHSITKLVQEIARLEAIKNGPPSRLEEWIKEQQRIAEEKRKAAEERKRAKEERKRRRVEEKRRAAEVRRQQFADLKRQMQQFTQGRLDKIVILASVLLLLCCLCSLASQVVSRPIPKATPTVTSVATLAPTPTPALLDTPTPPALTESSFIEPIRKQIFSDLVAAQDRGFGDEEAYAEIAKQWGTTVDTVKMIAAEGIGKGWLTPAATATPIPSPPTQPTEVTKFQITSTGVQENAPLIFKDLVVYRRHGAPDVDIFGYNLKTREEFPLVQRPGHQFPSGLFGKYLVYTEDTWDPTEEYNVRLLNIDTGEDILIASGPGNQSGGGIYRDLVTYTTDIANDGSEGLYVYDIKTGKREFVDSNVARPRIWGHNIVWYYGLGSGYYNIKGYNLNKEEFFEISSVNNGYQQTPDINGFNVVWTDGRDGKSAIYEKNLNTGKETLVYEVPTSGKVGWPVITNRYVAWVHSRGVGAHDIFVQNRITGEIVEVSNDGPQQLSPTVPDIWKDTVVWMSWHTGNGDIYGAILK